MGNNMENQDVIKTVEETDVKEIQSPIQDAGRKIQTNPPLMKFRTADGPFGWFAHGVTGDELNRFVNDIQKHLIESHENHIEIEGRYEQLIQDLGEFDKKYLQENIKAVKASEKACQEARDVRKEIDSLISDNTKLKKKLRVVSWLAGCSIVIAIAAFVMWFINYAK